MATDVARSPERSAPHDIAPDPVALQAILDGRYAEVRDLVRRNLVEHAGLLDEVDDLDRDTYRDRVLEVVQKVAATGQTGFGFPTEHGGGGDIGASVAAFETLAYGDLSVLVKVGVQFGLFGGAVLQLGTRRHHEAYLRRIIDGSLLGSFAMTESGHGSNVQALETTATFDLATDEFVLRTPHDAARKDYIGNAARHAEVAVVFAQLHIAGDSQGVHAFVVPIRVRDEDDRLVPAPGVRIEDCGHKMGLQGVDNGRIWFDDVRIPRENLLDRFATVSEAGVYDSEIESPGRRFFTTIGTLVQGRVSVGGAAINASKVAMTLAVRYAERRRQFEASGEQEELLLDYGLHQRRLLPLLAATYALHAAQEEVAGDLHAVFSGERTDDRSRRALESAAAGLKAYGTWHATRTIQECREACGGAGYLSASRFAALKADTDVFTTFEGDNHVLLQLVAKGLLTDYASDFQDADQLGMVRLVGGLALDEVVKRTRAHQLLERVRGLLPSGDEDEDETGVLDTSYQLAMLRYREEQVIASAARRLKSGVDDGIEPGEVFSRVQAHVIAAARAHVERTVLEAFVAKVESLPEGDERRVMGMLLDLHALSLIEADRAWFLEHGRMSSARAKQVRREVDHLCRRLRPHARVLVDAFAVPEEVLRAPDLLGPVVVAGEQGAAEVPGHHPLGETAEMVAEKVPDDA
ncbi:acyl-CoA dehydrogenase [Nocardioides zeae]|uniref:Acyl-CoA dehydrogenase n=1 Tax=Nocardioides imazamoxiresistens TaxID=3231893 RepID=A0ABU3PZK0_9ACTN|nr:acyl-CoA dehydrogenase [Nocardioides zeae]MDT9594693.1 acyl-CoA dehydrogenase [Nocardioides zeae]